jgi:uncharacterized protein YqeY
MDDMKNCMKAGDKGRLAVVRMLITEVKNAEINDTKQPGRERTEDECLEILAAYHKAIAKTIGEFPPDRQIALRAEMAIVEEFLPKQLDASAVQERIRALLESTPERQFGPLMKILQAELKGQVSGQALSTALKAALTP